MIVCSQVCLTLLSKPVNGLCAAVMSNADSVWVGGGTIRLASVKSITGQEILCKIQKICYFFDALNGVFGHV